MGAGCWPERREGGAGGAREKIAGGWALAREMHPSWALPGRRGGRGWALAAGDWAMCAFAVCQRERHGEVAICCSLLYGINSVSCYG